MCWHLAQTFKDHLFEWVSDKNLMHVKSFTAMSVIIYQCQLLFMEHSKHHMWLLNSYGIQILIFLNSLNSSIMNYKMYWMIEYMLWDIIWRIKNSPRNQFSIQKGFYGRQPSLRTKPALGPHLGIWWGMTRSIWDHQSIKFDLNFMLLIPSSIVHKFNSFLLKYRYSI